MDKELINDLENIYNYWYYRIFIKNKNNQLYKNLTNKDQVEIATAIVILSKTKNLICQYKIA